MLAMFRDADENVCGTVPARPPDAIGGPPEG
jgi:hypothetical protein